MRMDMEFRKALNSSDATKIQATIENPASQAFHISQAANLALSSNLSDQGRQFNQLLLDRFPRNYFGLIQRLYNPVFSPAESSEARKELKGVDPFASMCLDAPMPDRIVDFLGTLPLDKQLELLDGWGLGATFPNETFRSSNPRLQSAIKERIIGMCR